MNRRMTILRTIAVGTLVVALGSAAFGADTASVASANATQESGATAAGHATVHVDLSGVAASVIDLLVGGSNPSTEKRGGTHATTVKPDNDNDKDEATETEATTHVSSGLQVGQTATAGEKPGFGCGDKNHTHSGPPGRPGATLPPGCTKNH